LKIGGRRAGGEKAGGVASQRQFHPQSVYPGVAQLDAETASGSLAAPIAVGIETDGDGLSAAVELEKLLGVEMRPEPSHRLVETGLPQGRHIE
jgi:hypothetical protein